jgi:hypothetical protein
MLELDAVAGEDESVRTMNSLSAATTIPPPAISPSFLGTSS